MVQKILDSSSSFEHEHIGFVKFWKKIIPVFAQEKGLKFNSFFFLSYMKCSGLGYCIYGVERMLLEMKKKIDEKKFF